MRSMHRWFWLLSTACPGSLRGRGASTRKQILSTVTGQPGRPRATGTAPASRPATSRPAPMRTNSTAEDVLQRVAVRSRRPGETARSSLAAEVTTLGRRMRSERLEQLPMTAARKPAAELAVLRPATRTLAARAQRPARSFHRTTRRSSRSRRADVGRRHATQAQSCSVAAGTARRHRRGAARASKERSCAFRPLVAQLDSAGAATPWQAIDRCGPASRCVPHRRASISASGASTRRRCGSRGETRRLPSADACWRGQALSQFDRDVPAPVRRGEPRALCWCMPVFAVLLLPVADLAAAANAGACRARPGDARPRRRR